MSRSGRNDVERRPRVEGGDGVKLPVSENVARQTAPALEPRQGVDGVEDERVPAVEVGVAPVEVVVEDVGRLADERLGGDVADGVRPGVGGLEGEAVREAPVDPDLERVVVGVAR